MTQELHDTVLRNSNKIDDIQKVVNYFHKEFETLTSRIEALESLLPDHTVALYHDENRLREVLKMSSARDLKEEFPAIFDDIQAKGNPWVISLDDLVLILSKHVTFKVEYNHIKWALQREDANVDVQRGTGNKLHAFFAWAGPMVPYTLWAKRHLDKMGWSY